MNEMQTREVVRAYHDAYCRGDVQAAGAQLADSFHFSSPMMAFDTPQQHVAALARFVPFITGVDLISELYGEGEATLVYDLHTSLPAGTQRSAEHFRVSRSRIRSIVIIFDATPWHPIIKAAADIRAPLEVADQHPPVSDDEWSGGGLATRHKGKARGTPAQQSIKVASARQPPARI